MSVSKTKSGKWEARTTYNGVNYYFGVYRTKRGAERVVTQKLKLFKLIDSPAPLDSFKLGYELNGDVI